MRICKVVWTRRWRQLLCKATSSTKQKQLPSGAIRIFNTTTTTSNNDTSCTASRAISSTGNSASSSAGSATLWSQQFQCTRRSQPHGKQSRHHQTSATTIPGNSTYSDIVRIVLFRDSICNRFSEWQLNQKATNATIKKKSFPGATAKDLAEHHMHPYLKRNKPDVAIIHAGANDILQLSTKDGGLTDAQIHTVCEHVLTSGMICKEYGVSKVCISSVLPSKSKNFQLSSIFINNSLEQMCQEVGFHFIRNDNINYKFPTQDEPGLFYRDGLHLNDKGRDILMCNFINYLNNHGWLPQLDDLVAPKPIEIHPELLENPPSDLKINEPMNFNSRIFCWKNLHQIFQTIHFVQMRSPLISRYQHRGGL